MAETKSPPTRYIGLDVHKHYLIAIGVNPAGEQVGGPDVGPPVQVRETPSTGTPITSVWQVALISGEI